MDAWRYELVCVGVNPGESGHNPRCAGLRMRGSADANRRTTGTQAGGVMALLTAARKLAGALHTLATSAVYRPPSA